MNLAQVMITEACIDRSGDTDRVEHMKELLRRGASELEAMGRVLELLDYILQDDQCNRLIPRLTDLGYTAFRLAKRPNPEDGGPSDWFTDTRPQVMQMIEDLKKAFDEARRVS